MRAWIEIVEEREKKKKGEKRECYGGLMCMLAYDGLGLEDAFECLSEWFFGNPFTHCCIQLKFCVGVFVVSNC